MTKLNRVTGKVFGGDATATGDNPEIGQFGSALAGTYNGTTDVATIQNLPAWGQGWAGAVTPDTNFPALPEMTGFGKVLSYQNNYLLQSGIPEWDSGTIYYTNNFCRVGNVFYYSLTDENQGNDPTTDTTNWTSYDDKFMSFNATTNRVLKYTGITFGTATQSSSSSSLVNTPVTIKAGMTVLVPDGRNEDGSLKNIIYTLQDDFAATSSNTSPNTIRILLLNTAPDFSTFAVTNCWYFNKYSELQSATGVLGSGAAAYVEETNYWYRSGGTSTTRTWTQLSACPICIYTVAAAGSTAAFTPFYPAQFLTQNDNWWLSGIGMPSGRVIELTLGASGSTYTAPANGWVYFRADDYTISTTVGHFAMIFSYDSTATTAIGVSGTLYSASQGGTLDIICYLPVEAGTPYKLFYGGWSGVTPTFRFSYAVGVPSA